MIEVIFSILAGQGVLTLEILRRIIVTQTVISERDKNEVERRLELQKWRDEINIETAQLSDKVHVLEITTERRSGYRSN